MRYEYLAFLGEWHLAQTAEGELLLRNTTPDRVMYVDLAPIIDDHGNAWYLWDVGEEGEGFHLLLFGQERSLEGAVIAAEFAAVKE